VLGPPLNREINLAEQKLVDPGDHLSRNVPLHRQPLGPSQRLARSRLLGQGGDRPRETQEGTQKKCGGKQAIHGGAPAGEELQSDRRKLAPWGAERKLLFARFRPVITAFPCGKPKQ
jgi:hypothetical protein